MGGSEKLLTGPSRARRFNVVGAGFSDPEASRAWQKDRAAKIAARRIADDEQAAIRQAETMTEASRPVYEVLRRAYDAEDIHAAIEDIILSMRIDNASIGGDDRALGLDIYHALAKVAIGYPVLGSSSGGVASRAQASGGERQSGEPRPWAHLRTQEEGQAWVEGASAEELRAMAECLLSGGPVSRREAAPRRAIILAWCASAEVARRVQAAMRPASASRSASRGKGSAQGRRP